jgi:hypothetical protein
VGYPTLVATFSGYHEQRCVGELDIIFSVSKVTISP